LTFFFRQMPELIRRGHLFIAQPPLYKVARGKSEQYLLDDTALENYLYTEGQAEGALILASGETIAGADLADVIARARKADKAIAELPERFSRDVIVQAAIAGALREAGDDAQAAADRVSERLNTVSGEFERGWVGAPDGEGGYVFEREVRGVRERCAVGRDVLVSADARRVNDAMQGLIEIFERPPIWSRKDERAAVYGPGRLLHAVRAAGEKGIDIQRYKGLGEMNPDQLWQTTLDDNARVLLQVKIKEADDADDIFSRLMGDIVEPRRKFIQDNALSAELDI
jgi:DNA gyrase subunit B